MSAPTIRIFGRFCVSYVRILCVSFAIFLSVWLAIGVYNEYRKLSDEANIAKLNQKVSIYQQEVGSLPDLNLIDLYHKGLTKQRLQRTPFGGYYRLHPNQSVVYNPYLANR